MLLNPFFRERNLITVGTSMDQGIPRSQGMNGLGNVNKISLPHRVKGLVRAWVYDPVRAHPGKRDIPIQNTYCLFIVIR